MREIVVPKARAYAPPEDRKQPIQKLTVAYETTATEEEADIARQLIIESGGLEPCARDHAICNQTALKFAAMLPMRPDSASVVRDALRAEARRAAKAAS
jgi:hypothetical protein